MDHSRTAFRRPSLALGQQGTHGAGDREQLKPATQPRGEHSSRFSIGPHCAERNTRGAAKQCGQRISRGPTRPWPPPYDVGMAIDTKGNAWGWGYNPQYPLCVKQGLVLQPTKLPFAHVTLATGAGWHALYESNGKLYACGKNAAGELGDGTTTTSSVPMAVVGLPDQPIKALVSAWEDSGALLSNGSCHDWGYNSGDQLGNATTTNSDIPVHLSLPYPVAQISMGGSTYYNGQTIAILAGGSTWAWGTDQYGQLGIGKVVSSSGPTVVDVPHGVTFVQVSSGGSAMYAIDASGGSWAWGINKLDHLGIGHVKLSDVPIHIGLDLGCVSATAANLLVQGPPFHEQPTRIIAAVEPLRSTAPSEGIGQPHRTSNI